MILLRLKNKSLARANLSDASLAHSNLSGVNLDGTILAQTNFGGASLSGLDFTDIGLVNQVHGSTFINANLSDSNFEGVDLSHQGVYHKVFKDKAYLINSSHIQVVRDLWSDGGQQQILSLEVRGNDLAVDYILFNNFKNTNLEKCQTLKMQI